MALEEEALFLRKAVRLGALDPDKGTAALYVYSQLKKMGAKFSFGLFLVERGLLSQMALRALEEGSQTELKRVDTVGDFQLIELIGEGENGAVFRALQKSLNRMVAVKILSTDVSSNPECVEQFLREARATARINHPNVVQGIDVGHDQGLHFFAMELVNGGSARKLLESRGRLDEFTALSLVREAAEGLKAAHDAGLTHRDLKPDNILLTVEGHAKLVDLGISQNLGAKARGEPGADFWASPPYVAPEIISGLSENDSRSDIYSLGATLFEFLAGQPPYIGETPEDTMRLHLNAPIPDILAFRPDISPNTAGLITRMLAKDPAERAPTAEVVSSAILRILTPKEDARAARVPSAKPAGPTSARVPAVVPAPAPHARALAPAAVPPAVQAPAMVPAARVAGRPAASGTMRPAVAPPASSPQHPARPAGLARPNALPQKSKPGAGHGQIPALRRLASPPPRPQTPELEELLPEEDSCAPAPPPPDASGRARAATRDLEELAPLEEVPRARVPSARGVAPRTRPQTQELDELLPSENDPGYSTPRLPVPPVAESPEAVAETLCAPQPPRRGPIPPRPAQPRVPGPAPASRSGQPPPRPKFPVRGVRPTNPKQKPKK
ncbi:MAG TPA: protein kinase [Planctomycetota bacterium]